MQHWYDENANYKSNSLPRNILWKNCCGDILRETLLVCNIISFRLCCSPCIFPLRSIRFILFSIMKFKCNSRGWNLQYIKCKILFYTKFMRKNCFRQRSSLALHANVDMFWFDEMMWNGVWSIHSHFKIVMKMIE